MKFRDAMMAVAALTAAQGITASPAQASGRMTCDSGPQSSWQSAETLETQLRGEGWDIRRTEVDGNCYEVYATTPDGDRVEAYFHPVTLAKLMVIRRGGEVIFDARSSQ